MVFFFEGVFILTDTSFPALSELARDWLRKPQSLQTKKVVRSSLQRSIYCELQIDQVTLGQATTVSTRARRSAADVEQLLRLDRRSTDERLYSWQSTGARI